METKYYEVFWGDYPVRCGVKVQNFGDGIWLHQLIGLSLW